MPMLEARHLHADGDALARLSLAEWDELLQLSRHHNLIGRIAERAPLERLPAPVRPHLVAARRLSLHQRQAVGWECAHLARALEGVPGPIVLLKGAAYAMAGQTAAAGRLFGDIDLLVPREQLPHVESQLMLAGWSANADAYDQRYYREWMHELPPFTQHTRGTVVDVHHNILPPVSRRAPDARLLLDASVPIEGTPFRRLQLADQILHSATHLFHEGSFENLLRDLGDLDGLFGEFIAQGANWDALRARAQQLGLTLELALALHHARQVLGSPVPAELVQALREAVGLTGWRLRWLDRAYAIAFRPRHLRSGWSDRWALWALHVRSHALRMPLPQLVWHLGRKLLLRFVTHAPS